MAERSRGAHTFLTPSVDHQGVISFNSTRETVAFLARRATWGLGPGELDEFEARGVRGTIDRLVDPTGAGIEEESPVWAGMDMTYDRSDRDAARAWTVDAFRRWIDRLVESGRPLDHHLAWFWHDHFAVSTQVVKTLPAFLDHLELCRSAGRGDFRELIRRVTVDPAMLVFLDGATSTGAAPNENYGRELLELYTVGIGNFAEEDVKAAATALTGWTVRRSDGTARFVPRRHDDTPQTLLGVDGVHDVDTTVAAVTDNPACPVFIASKMARHFLGAVDNSTIFALGDQFAEADLSISSLARATLEAGVAGTATPVVQAPFPWLMQISKALELRTGIEEIATALGSMGQLPGRPPNVGGYPGAATWLASSATAARFSVSTAMARSAATDAAAMDAARAADWDLLADLLLRPAGFSEPTLSALDGLNPAASDRPGEAALALALASPDLLIA